MIRYDETAAVLKALSDPTRLEIVDMISCCEHCACKILERFDITQPTLSHHMRCLCACGLVLARKEGKWTYYSLNQDVVSDLNESMRELFATEECSCDDEGCGCAK